MSDAANFRLWPGLAGTAAPTAPAVAPQLVYVVENDRISSVITELIVRKNLCSGAVQCYANGRDAFDALAAATRAGHGVPDLLLLDLDMPLMDGWEFLDALAGLTPTPATTVFVLTSSIHPDDLAKAASYPQVAGFFTKPLNEGSVACMQELLREGAAPVAAGAAISTRPLAMNFTPDATSAG